MTTAGFIEEQLEREIAVKMNIIEGESRKECQVIILERQNKFSIELGSDKKYEYEWEYKRENFLRFLLGALETPSYLYYKIANRTPEYVIDLQQTYENIKEKIKERREDGFLNENEKNEFLEELLFIKKETSMTYEKLESIWHSRFDRMIEKGICEKYAWNDENVYFEEDWECVHFCENIAPNISKVIRENLSEGDLKE